MGACARALPSLLLALLLTSPPGALGANPGLVVRITDKGLEYGKKCWLSAGLADPLGTRLPWVPAGHRKGALPQAQSRVAFLVRGTGSDSGLITQPLGHSGTYLP